MLWDASLASQLPESPLSSGKTLSQPQRAMIRESAKRGVPLRKLAVYHNTSRKTVTRVLNKASVGDSRWEDDHVLSIPWSNFINLTDDSEVPTSISTTFTH